MSLAQDTQDLYDFASRHYPLGWVYEDVEMELRWKRSKFTRVLRATRKWLKGFGWNIYCHRNGTDRLYAYVLSNDVGMQNQRYYPVWCKDLGTRLESGADLTQSTVIAAQGMGTNQQRVLELFHEHVRAESESFTTLVKFIQSSL